MPAGRRPMLTWVVVVVMSCPTCGGEGAEGVEPPRVARSPVSIAAPSPDSIAAPVPEAVASTPEAPSAVPDLEESGLRVAYRACPDMIDVARVGDDVYAYYMSAGIGRIDRLDALGARVATLDLDLPAPSPRDHAREPIWRKRGGWSPELPLGDVNEILGADSGEVYLLAGFHIHASAWESRLFTRRAGRWRRVPSGDSTQVFPRDGGVMLGFGDEDAWGFDGPAFSRVEGRAPIPSFDPLLEHAARAGDVDPVDESVDSAGISVLTLEVPRSGPILAVVTYTLPSDEVVGTWLMVWTDASEPASISRIAESLPTSAQVVGDGAGGGYVRLDDSLLRWQGEDVTPIAPPPWGDDAGPDEVSLLAGLDPSRRPWIYRGGTVALLEATGWKVERLPGTAAIRQLTGVQFGTPWAVRGDGSLWSRRPDGRWVKRPFVEDGPSAAPGGASEDILVMIGADDPWLIRDNVVEAAPTVDTHGRYRAPSMLYTLRPLARPNVCR